MRIVLQNGIDLVLCAGDVAAHQHDFAESVAALRIVRRLRHDFLVNRNRFVQTANRGIEVSEHRAPFGLVAVQLCEHFVRLFRLIQTLVNEIEAGEDEASFAVSRFDLHGFLKLRFGSVLAICLDQELSEFVVHQRRSFVD